MTKDVKVRFSDRQHEMVVAAADEHGSMSEAIRHAVEQVYGGDEPESSRRNAHLPKELQDAHQRLWDETGQHPILRISRSISVLSQHLGIDADTVKRDYLDQLQRANMITLIEGMKLIVKDPIDADLVDFSDLADETAEPETVDDAETRVYQDAEAVTDGGRP